MSYGIWRITPRVPALRGRKRCVWVRRKYMIFPSLGLSQNHSGVVRRINSMFRDGVLIYRRRNLRMTEFQDACRNRFLHKKLSRHTPFGKNHSPLPRGLLCGRLQTPWNFSRCGEYFSGPHAAAKVHNLFPFVPVPHTGEVVSGWQIVCARPE